MLKVETEIKDVFLLRNKIFFDSRGQFLKNFNSSSLLGTGICFNISESFFSSSSRDVIRGMHFQRPPCDHNKIVSVIQGRILDVVVDLRAGKQFGKFFAVELSSAKGESLFVPKGFAHGFLSLEDCSIVHYLTDFEYSPKNDTGIRFDSFGFKWPIKKAIVSERDLSFKSLNDFSKEKIW